MERCGYLSFFTLDEARERAAAMHERCREAGMRTRNTLNFSHGTRLELSGMTASLNYNHRYDERLLHATYTDINGRPRLKGMEFHHWSHLNETTQVDDVIAAVSIEQALCQIARFVDFESMVMALDWAMCRNEQLRMTTREQLVSYVDGIGSFQGVSSFRKALSASAENTDSPQETLLRLESDKRGMPQLQVNYPIALPLTGRTVYVDMAYPQYHVILEYDGRYHYTMDRWEADIDKRNNLQHAGWHVFPATRLTFATKRSLDDYFHMVGAAIADFKNNGCFTM